MMNLRYMTAKIPFSNAAGQHVTLCMTAAQEVGRFIARAISLPQWPQELLMCGERVTTLHLVTIAQTARGSKRVLLSRAKQFADQTRTNLPARQHSLARFTVFGYRALSRHSRPSSGHPHSQPDRYTRGPVRLCSTKSERRLTCYPSLVIPSLAVARLGRTMTTEKQPGCCKHKAERAKRVIPTL